MIYVIFFDRTANKTKQKNTTGERGCEALLCGRAQRSSALPAPKTLTPIGPMPFRIATIQADMELKSCLSNILAFFSKATRARVVSQVHLR